MGANPEILVDARHGIEYRAVPSSAGSGWILQWRPIGALKRFMTFSYITRREQFGSADEALQFIRRNAGAIVSGA